MRQKNVVREHTIECVDNDSGEVKSTKSFTTQKVDAEPEYIKLYLDDMSRWANLSKGESSILGALLRYMNYDNIIPLNACIKKTIATALETTTRTIDVQLSKLCKSGIFTRVGTGTYMANPYIFGRGKWTEIKEIRATVIYDKNGVSFSVITNPAKQLSIPTFDDDEHQRDAFDDFLDRTILPIQKFDDTARRIIYNAHKSKK